MTGKFHHLWGEVGGYKKPEALIYECGAMLAQGARCSIGDHLHPTGSLDQSTYRTIAGAYEHVKAARALGGRLGEPRRDRRAQRGSGGAAAARRHSGPSRRCGRGRGPAAARRQVHLRPARPRIGFFALPAADPARCDRGLAEAQDQGRGLRRGMAAACCSPAAAASTPTRVSSSMSAPKWHGAFALQGGRLPASGQAAARLVRRRSAVHVRGGGAHPGEAGAFARRHLRSLFRSLRQAFQRPRQHAEPAGPVRLRRRLRKRRLRLHGAPAVHRLQAHRRSRHARDRRECRGARARPRSA